MDPGIADYGPVKSAMKVSLLCLRVCFSNLAITMNFHGISRC